MRGKREKEELVPQALQGGRTLTDLAVVAIAIASNSDDDETSERPKEKKKKKTAPAQ